MQQVGGRDHSKDTLPYTPVQVPSVTLIMRQGPTPGKRFTLSQNAISIGRLEDNEVVINEQQISRRHASLTWEKGRFVLRDLGSANGTFLNGVQITAPQELHDGDVIGLSEILLAFRSSAPRRGDQTLAMPSSVREMARRAAARELVGKEVQGGMTWWPIVAALGLLIVLAAVTASLWLSLGGPQTVPTVSISSPADGTEFKTGDKVVVVSTANDERGVSKLELWVNDVFYVANDAQGQTSFSVEQKWAPTEVGSYNLQVKAYNIDNVVSEPASVLVKVAPGAVAPAGSCQPDMALVEDVTLPPGEVVEAGKRLDKTWKLKNTGTCAWDAGYQLVFISGEQMNAPDYQPLPNAAPEAEINVGVTLKAPWDPGAHSGTWQLKSPTGEYFGEELKVVIKVEEPPPIPQPKPTVR